MHKYITSLNPNSEIVWKDIIIAVVAGCFWHVQTVILIVAYADIFSLFSLLVLLLKPGLRFSVQHKLWTLLYTVMVSLVSGTILAFNIFVKYSSYSSQTPYCSTRRLVINFLVTSDWENLPIEATFFVIHLATCILYFMLPKTFNYKIGSPDCIDFSPTTKNQMSTSLCVVLLFVAGCMWPSLLSAPYFCCALGCTMAWAWSLRCFPARTFRVLMHVLLVVSVVHQVLLLVYQQPTMQRLVPPSNHIVRLVGLTNLIPTSCEVPGTNQVRMFPVLPARLNPIIILFLYFAIRNYLYASDEDSERQQEVLSSTQNDSLSRGISSETDDDQTLERDTKVEDLVLGTITNTVMMIWSVVFHSWMGFLMLVWANLMWTVPRQRRAMGISARALSIYAALLLVLSYSFSVDAAWPSHFGAVSMKQLGLLTNFRNPVVPLLIKSSFTLIFLAVLRQYTRPYFVGLRIRISVFKQTVQVLTLMWTRCAIIFVGIVLIIFEHKTYKLLSVSLTIALTVAAMMPHRPRLPLCIFFVGLIILSELKLTLTYTYQFDGSAEFFDKIFKAVIYHVPLKHALGLQVLKKERLLIHLWLPTIAAMLSGIFLTVLMDNMCVELHKSWKRWSTYIKQFVVTPVDDADDK